ncbi:L-lactate dehydrogenase [Cutibacterium acnes JCM 18916]|nr:L-lactate dehydrogenase [Cutibacterium acnes JCM 18916]GAE77080.1 L-lactate dehydrogenase [Cutibacterium acnes JCM 18918]
MPGLPGAGMTVGLFITCINDVMFPQTGVAVTTLLERLAAKLSSHGNRPVAPR